MAQIECRFDVQNVDAWVSKIAYVFAKPSSDQTVQHKFQSVEKKLKSWIHHLGLSKDNLASLQI